MASWEDFYVGEDFDSLDFAEEDEIPSDPDFGEENGHGGNGTDELFCSCKMPETGEMIECAGTSCPGRNWYHFDSIGMIPDEVPAGDWFCQSCTGVGSTDKTELPKETNATVPEKTAEPKKKRMRTKRVTLPRTKRFQLCDATTQATQYVASILDVMPEHPVFLKKIVIVGACLALAATMLLSVRDQTFEEFCVYLITQMWTVLTAGDSKPLQYRETLVMHFHALRIDDILLDKWDGLLDSVNINCEQLVSDCVLQHRLDMLLEQMLSDRNSTDLPHLEEEINSTKMEKNEEQVLNYVGGYIPFALLKHYKKLKNSIAQKFVDVLNTWCVDGPYEGQHSFLNYTRKWIEAQSRGRLFQPKPDVFLFFRAAENETRKHLHTAIIGKYRNINLRELLTKKLSCNGPIQKYWTVLVGTNKLSCSESKLLFKNTITYYVNIRCRAFVLVYMDLKRVNDKNISRKGSKSLRKELNSK